MTPEELLALVREIDWDLVLDLVDTPEAEYPLSAAEKETLARLRSQIERLQAAQFDGGDAGE